MPRYVTHFIVAGLMVGCFREAPPCDAATLERIEATCANEVDCIRQIDEREAICEERMRRGE